MDDSFQLGENAYLSGDFSEAEKQFTLALNDGGAIYNRALTRFRLKNYVGANEDLDDYIKKFGADNRIWYLKTIVAAGLNRYVDAFYYSTLTVDADPYSIESVILMSRMSAANELEWNVLDELSLCGSTAYELNGFIKIKTNKNDNLVLSQFNTLSPFSGGFWDTCLFPIFFRDIEKVFLLGAGGGTIPLIYSHFSDAKFTAADLIATNCVKTLKYMNSKPLEIKQGDGLEILSESKKKYDVIIVDAFIDDKVPNHLIEESAINKYRAKLVVDGFLIINTLEDSENDDTDVVEGILEKNFKNTYSIPLECNRIFFASDGETDLKKLVNPKDSRLESLGNYLNRLIVSVKRIS